MNAGESARNFQDMPSIHLYSALKHERIKIIKNGFLQHTRQSVLNLNIAENKYLEDIEN